MDGDGDEGEDGSVDEVKNKIAQKCRLYVIYVHYKNQTTQTMIYLLT